MAGTNRGGGNKKGGGSNDKGNQKQEGGKRNPQKDKGEIKQNLSNMIEEEMLKIDYEDYRMRENIRKALGIGNYRDFKEEFEVGFARSVQPPQEPTKTEPYDRPYKVRPRILRVTKMKREPK